MREKYYFSLLILLLNFNGSYWFSHFHILNMRIFPVWRNFCSVKCFFFLFRVGGGAVNRTLLICRIKVGIELILLFFNITCLYFGQHLFLSFTEKEMAKFQQVNTHCAGYIFMLHIHVIPDSSLSQKLIGLQWDRSSAPGFIQTLKQL